jgi:hypothetical protein
MRLWADGNHQHQHRSHGQPLDVTYGATGANIVSSLSNDYRGQPFLRPNVTGSATSQSRSAMLNTYFAGYTFATPPASAPYGNVGRNSFRAPNFDQWDFSADKNFRIFASAPSAIPVGVLQHPEPHEFRHTEHTNHQRRFRNHSRTYPSRQIQFALKLIF